MTDGDVIEKWERDCFISIDHLRKMDAEHRFRFALPERFWRSGIVDVFVTGDWIDWDQGERRMRLHPSEDNPLIWWSDTIRLQSGRVYRFKFMVGSEWCLSSDEPFVHDASWKIQEHALVVSGNGQKEGGKVMVVLGKCLRPDGEPLPELVSRTQMTVDRFLKERTSEADFIILTGGKAQKDVPHSESFVMKRIGREHLSSATFQREAMDLCSAIGAIPSGSGCGSREGVGLSLVNETHLIEEDLSLTTVENAIRTAEILMSRKNVEEVTIVTGEYHMARSMMTFEMVFERLFAKRGLRKPVLVPFPILDNVSGLTPKEIVFNNANEKRIIPHVPRLVSEFDHLF